MRKDCIIVVIFLALSSFTFANTPEQKGCTDVFQTLIINLSDKGQDEYGKYAELFAKHLKLRSPVINCRIVAGQLNDSNENSLIIYVGTAEKDAYLKKWFYGKGVISEKNKMHPESFVIDFEMGQSNLQKVYILGADNRGVLYGLGKFLYLSMLEENGVKFQMTNLYSAPAFEVRSANCQLTLPMDPGVTKNRNARKWSKQEGINSLEETVLAGANAQMHGWGGSPPLSLKDYPVKGEKAVSRWRNDISAELGILFIVQNSINGLQEKDVEKEWIAEHFADDPKLICPSVPEARAALIKSRELYFKHCGKIDHFIICPADVAGCHCEKCKPWANTVYNLSKEIADVLHKYHPNAKVYVSNQEYDWNENDLFFNRIRNEDSSWLAGYSYAPGGSENSTYGYLKLNEKWNIYPGCSPDYTFLKSRLNYLHPYQDILSFPDITHWKRSENGLKVIDPVLSEVYHRRTFNARPKAYEKILKQTFPYINGSTAYTEGIYDDFNKFLFLRLLWNPNLSAKEIALEYYTYHCGLEAGKILAKAVFSGEENYAKSVLQNADGIEKFYSMVEQAGKIMPEHYMKNNWRYRMICERATIDLYLLYKQQAATEIYNKAISELTNIDSKQKEFKNALVEVKESLSKPVETEKMLLLKQQAERLDNDINDIAAVRFHAIGTMDKVDNVGIIWLRSQIEKAIQLQDESQSKKVIENVLNYTKIEDGEFYDNCGTIDQQSHFDFSSGELYYGTGKWPKDARPSQRYYNYSFNAIDGLVFNYTNLDANAKYQATVCYPNPGGVSFALDSSREFLIYADGVQIGHAKPVGNGFEYFTFDIPAEITSDGLLRLETRKGPRSKYTCISEVWIKKVKQK